MPSIAPYSSMTIAMCWFVAPELGEQRGEVLRLGNHVRRAQRAPRRSTFAMPAVVQRREQVADVQDADDLVERLAVDRVARVRRVERPPRAPPRRAGRPRSRPPRAAAPSRRRPPCRRSRRPCRASPARRARSRPARLERESEHPQLRLGVRRALGAGGSSPSSAQRRPRSSAAAARSAAGRRRRSRAPGAETASAVRSEWLSAIALRHELADHDVEVGDDQERDARTRAPSPATGSKTCASTGSPRAPMASE